MNSCLITDNTGSSNAYVMWVKKLHVGLAIILFTELAFLCLIVSSVVAAERDEDVTFFCHRHSHCKDPVSAWAAKNWLVVSPLWPPPGLMWRHPPPASYPTRGVDQNKASIALSGTCHILLPITPLSMTWKKNGEKRGGRVHFPFVWTNIKGSTPLGLHVGATVSRSASWLYTLQGAKQQKL